MPFEQQTLRDQLEAKLVVNPAVRMTLAVVVIAGGLCFIGVGALLFFLFTMTKAQPVHPVAALASSVLIAALGAAFLWLGIRMARTRPNSQHLLSAVARRRASLIVGGLAVFMLVGAYEASSLPYLAAALALVMFSYWLFPLAKH